MDYRIAVDSKRLPEITVTKSQAIVEVCFYIIAEFLADNFAIIGHHLLLGPGRIVEIIFLGQTCADIL